MGAIIPHMPDASLASDIVRYMLVTIAASLAGLIVLIVSTCRGP